MKRNFNHLLLAVLAALVVSSAAAQTAKSGAFKGKRLMYTTYFYTATEAVVHGYEKNTKVRIISLEKNRTVWEGVVGPGDTKLIPTGRGVFSFVSDKKASILVGTPSSCTAVGYWLRDKEGSYRSNHFYTQLPSSVSDDDARVVVWAWEPTNFSITDLTSDKTLHRGSLKAGEYYELDNKALSSLGNHVLDIRAKKPNIQVQVYYDEGFFVPSKDGRVAGKIFYSYVGSITNGVNDLNLISYLRPVEAEVTDIKTGKRIWKGTVGKGQVHTLTLSKKHVKVTAKSEIAVAVAPYKHDNIAGYAEHHFGAGLEGMGIENDFILMTPQEVWLFSYYDNNQVTIEDANGKQIWKGKLMAGHVHGVSPGQGLFRIKGNKGMSVMGGASNCGAEYSPAGGLFKVDEELLKVATTILQERKLKAQQEGRTLTPAEASRPLSKKEMQRAQKVLRDNLGQSVSEDEVQQRMDSMKTY